MDLSIIIVNWNSKDYLRNCIASILDNTHKIEFEIIVIDAASFDGCDEMLRQCFPQVRYIQSNENVGFAKANNAAFQISQGKSVLFLNPDTELLGPAIAIMHQHLQTLTDVGAVGCKLLNSDMTLQTSSVQAFPTILNQVIDTEALRQHFPRWQFWGMRPLFDQTEMPTEVDAISGACLMVRRSVFEKVGMFSAYYFMYSEDVDLCFKIRSSGLKNYYIPTAVIVHHGGGSSRQATVSNFSNVMLMESLWRFFVTNRSFVYGCFYRMSMMIVSVLRIIVAILLWQACALPDNKATWKSAFQKWRVKLRWTLGKERWIKDY